MRFALAAALALLAPAAFGAEPDICYATEPPPDAIVTEHRGASPFTGFDHTLSSLYLPRALCGFDVEADKSFWRSFVAAFGCSPESEIASLLNGWLDEAPAAAQPDFDAARDAQPDRVAALCARVSDCVVPEKYDIEGKTGFYCPSLGG